MLKYYVKMKLPKKIKNFKYIKKIVLNYKNELFFN